jgi:branched-chain amino acid transport system permease protein
MVSFGHAAFLGAGAYTVAILMQHDVTSAWIAWPVAIAVSTVCAFLIGAISLRTRGVYFIMITLAFAQMLYYVFVSLRAYGGEDGLALPQRSHIAPVLDMRDEVTFYYVVLACLTASVYLLHRAVNARFGYVIQGIRENEARMEAIGFPTYRYKLLAFMIGGAFAGLAGVLLANQNGFVSPSLLHWTQSGTLMIMVILGGVGRLLGGVIGALVFLCLEEFLSSRTEHWQLALGILLLAAVLYAPHGLAGVVVRRNQNDA